MPEEPNTTEVEAVEAKKKDRSPAYPAIGLRKALENARKLWEGGVKHHSVLVPVAAESMGYTPKSSVGVSAISAMKKFGLLLEEGSKDQRKVRLTDFAKIVLNPNTPNRERLLKDAALLPTIHRELWDEYGGALPPDAQVKNDLTFGRQFTESAADALIEEFKDTIEFVNLGQSDKIDGSPAGEDGDGQLPMFNQTPIPSSSSGGASTQPPPAAQGFFSRSLGLVPAQSAPPSTGKQLRMDLDSGPVVVNYPMSEEDFDLMVNTLNVWKPKLTKQLPTPETAPEAATGTP